MILKPAPVSTRRFSVAKDGTLVAEISDLNGYGRVYDDACDVGLTLVSHKTGRQIVFVVEHQERDREWELLFEDLLPADLRVRREMPNLKVRIFND